MVDGLLSGVFLLFVFLGGLFFHLQHFEPREERRTTKWCRELFPTCMLPPGDCIFICLFFAFGN